MYSTYYGLNATLCIFYTSSYFIFIMILLLFVFIYQMKGSRHGQVKENACGTTGSKWQSSELTSTISLQSWTHNIRLGVTHKMQGREGRSVVICACIVLGKPYSQPSLLRAVRKTRDCLGMDKKGSLNQEGSRVAWKYQPKF